MIKKLLQEKNKNFFFPRSMQLELLHNCPETIPTLAQRLYEEWHTYDASLTKERLIQSFNTRLNKDKIPLTFVVLKDQLPIGTISLKHETAPEFADFPETLVWIGSLHVAPKERNQGIGQNLLEVAQTSAKEFGQDHLYIYTSNSTNVKWILNKGAHLIEKRPFRNHKITIMQFLLKDSKKK